jgi:WD40 repeat protein
VESSLEAGKGALEVWDVASQRLIKSLEPQQCGSLAFSQDSHWLLSLAMEGGTIYDTAGFEIADQFSGFYWGLNQGAFQPGGTLVAVPKAQQGRVLLRDLRRHEVVAEFYEPEYPRVTAFASDGSFLVIANTTGVNLYSMDGLDGYLPIKGHSMGVQAVAFSPNGSQLVSVGKDSSLQLWDAASGRHIWSGSQLLPTQGHSVCFSPDGKLLATGESGRPEVLLWEAQTGRLLCELTNGHTGISWSLQFLPESKEGLYLIRGGGVWRTLGASVALWKISSTDDVLHNLPHAVEQVASLSKGGVIGLVVAPTGDRIAYMDWPESGDVEVIVSNVLGKRTPKCLTSADFFYLSCQPLAFTPDGKSVLTLLPESRILVLDVATGQTNRSFKVTGRDNVCERNFTLSPNGRWLAIVATTKRAVEIYDFEKGELLYTLQGRESAVWWLAWHPTEPRLAVSRDNGSIAISDLSRIDRQLEQLGFGEVGGSTAQTFH